MHELLDDAIANGAYGAIPGHLMLAARKNPLLDWNAPLKEVLNARTISVGNRVYSTCLIGIPLHGDLGTAFAKVMAVTNILREAQAAKLLAKDDGLIFLDSPLPRSTIQMMTVEDIYNLIPRLFERGVRGNQLPVLDARVTEAETANIDAAVMVGLLYWRADGQKPTLLTETKAQASLAKIVARYVAFDRATPACPLPTVESQPMEPFLSATTSSSRHIAKRYLNQLISRVGISADQAVFNVLPSEAPWGEYQIEVTLQTGSSMGQYAMTLYLDELRDGTVSDMLSHLIAIVGQHNIKDCRISYLQTTHATISLADAEEFVRSPIALH